MKRVLKIWLVVPLLAIAQGGRAQGFVNLSLQSASIPSNATAGSTVAIAGAVPGWTGYIGGAQQTTILYNDLFLGTTTLAILGTNNPIGQPIPAGSQYVIFLQAGDYNDSQEPASLAQSAMIPIGSESIIFTASAPYAAGWQVTINGQVVPVSQIGTAGGFYNIYSGDVSAFAGQVDNLAFTALIGPGAMVSMALDNIQFSSSAVPEPGALGLFGLGAAVLAWRRLKLM